MPEMLLMSAATHEPGVQTMPSRKPRTVVPGVQIAIGALCLAALSAGAIWLLTDSSGSRLDRIRLAAVEHWPEVKNGLPELAPARPPAPIRVDAAAAAAPAAPAPTL